MNPVRQWLKSALATVLPELMFLVQGPRHAQIEPVEVALTFDDGPHPKYTPRLLDVLASENAKATFFVIGEQAARHPALIRRMIDEGHDIGNHTWTHSEPSKTSTAQFLAEVVQTRNLIQDLTGRDCRIMRPPKGSLTIGKAIGLWRQKQTIVLWNVDPKDFAMPDSAVMLRWMKNYEPRSGDILLLHDNHPHAIVAVKQLVENRRIDLRTISEWLIPRLRQPKRLQIRTTDCEVANVG